MKNKKTNRILFKIVLIVSLFFASIVFSGKAEISFLTKESLQRNKEIDKIQLSSSLFKLELLEASQTAFALRPNEDPEFDFTIHEWLNKDGKHSRKDDGYYHLGDINFRIRVDGDTSWKSYSTASERKPVISLSSESEIVLAAANLNSTLPESCPVIVNRFWENLQDRLVLRFEIKNEGLKTIEIGGLGIPMIFNNILNDKSLDDVHVENVFFDPYIGMDAGYLQVVRLNGDGPVLLVLPHEKTPFEAYRPLLDDPMPRGITFEGYHEWMIHSKAYAENEWKDAKQWNNPTSYTVGAGETYSFGIEFVLAESVENIEETLLKYNRPVAIGIPGYVLPMDVEGKLFVKYAKSIKSVEVEPLGALSFNNVDNLSANEWNTYQVKGEKWGRARLTINFEDDTKQTINYNVIKPEPELVADNGHFLTTKQWFNDPNDLFNRNPSVISYDIEKDKQVIQDERAWIAGLSDEGGAGAWLNAIMKQLIQPSLEEVKKLEEFVNKTLWGGIQYNTGELKYGVKKSMFLYDPENMPEGTYSKDINYDTWGAWSPKEAASPGRSYNYPHVAAAHWVMYRLARNYTGLITYNDWSWYLENSFEPTMAMVKHAPYYAQFGQMEGTIFLLLLDDLQREGWSDKADILESAMKERVEHWASLNYPFGSEMPWDSTGQEEVYMWSKYFGFDEKANVTLQAILAYMPTVPHWGYNGCARRYWDFLYAGKLKRIERQIHHYGSALNAIPVLRSYKENPSNLYLLRVGYGGLLGAVSNITEEGFAPSAFHSFPSTLEVDGISGDYGTGFFGYAVNSCSYIINDKEFGWLSFGGNLREDANWLNFEITSASASRVYIAPIGLEISLDAGAFKSLSFNYKSNEIRVTLKEKSPYVSNGLLRLTSYNGTQLDNLTVDGYQKNNRGLFVIPLEDQGVTQFNINNINKL